MLTLHQVFIFAFPTSSPHLLLARGSISCRESRRVWVTLPWFGGERSYTVSRHSVLPIPLAVDVGWEWAFAGGGLKQNRSQNFLKKSQNKVILFFSSSRSSRQPSYNQESQAWEKADLVEAKTDEWGGRIVFSKISELPNRFSPAFQVLYHCTTIQAHKFLLLLGQFELLPVWLRALNMHCLTWSSQQPPEINTMCVITL